MFRLSIIGQSTGHEEYGGHGRVSGHFILQTGTAPEEGERLY